jgi:hypothetical protein
LVIGSRAESSDIEVRYRDVLIRLRAMIEDDLAPNESGLRPVPERRFDRSYCRFVRRAWAERRPCHQLFTLRIGCHATLVASGASVRSWDATGLVTPAASAGRVVTPARMNTASTPSVPKPIWRIEVSCFAILVAI